MKYLFLLLGIGVSSNVFAQLTIYSEPGQSGSSASCALSIIYKGGDIPGGLNDQCSSILLQKGYMATLAENEDGTGDNYTFVAAISDISVDLSRFLNNKVSFIRVLPFRNTLKKGVGNQNNAFIDQLNVSWFYDWGASDVSLTDREYAMNAWGRQAASNPANIANYINKPDVTHLLSFNEPDNSDQSNIPVAEAIPLHKNLSATGLRIGSPAPTESQAFVWLRDFMAGTRQQNIKVDHMVIHWYDWGSYLNTGNTAPDPTGVFNRFRDHVNRVYSIYGKPIWIKEFNANRNTTSATHEAFIKLALPWLEEQSFVERYAYFFPPAWPPVDGNGNITPIGIAYRDFNTSTPAIIRNIDNTELFPDDLNKKFEGETASRFGSNIINCATASGGQMVQAVAGANNRVAFHNIVIPEAGTYNMEVRYFSIAPRNLTLRINHGPAKVVAIPASGAQWCFEGGSPGTYLIPVNLLAGTNTIEFTESPIIDFIEVKKDGGALPVSLIDFNGLVRAKAIELNWKTAQEYNSLHFEVLKSKDGVIFNTIGRVNAAGNSTGLNAYQFLDNTPAVGANYYKLKQVDLDGSIMYSKNVLINFGIQSEGLILVSATENSISVSMYSNKNERASVMLVSLDGKMLHQRQVMLSEGMNLIQIPVLRIRGNINVVVVRTNEQMNSIKVLR